MDTPGRLFKKMLKPVADSTSASDEMVASLTEMREKIFTTILTVSLLLLIPAVISSLSRISAVGFKPIMLLQTVTIPLALLLYFARSRIPYVIRGSIFVLWILILGLVGLINFGLVGGAKVFLIVIAPLMSALIMGRRAGFLALAAGLVIMSTAAILTISGKLRWDFDFWKYMLSPSAWLDQIIGVGAIIATILLAISRIHGFLNSSIRILEQRNRELQQTNAALEEETFKLCRAEEIRRQHENRFNAVVDYMPLIAILTSDHAGRIMSWNRAAEALFDISKDEAIGKTPERLIMTRREADAFYRVLTAIDATSAAGQPTEWSFTKQDGSVKTLLYSIFPIPGMGDSREFVSMAIDITDRKHAEEKVLSSLKEKEVMLTEIHHRVKNNLQLITSLLNLQADKKQSEELTVGFKEASSRIYSMALIHEQLYRSHNFSRIDLAEYLPLLAKELCTALSLRPGMINVSYDMEPTYLDIDTAIPCGLIVNEILTNALKYAFPDNSRTGEIMISVRRGCDGEVVLSISDNGTGLPDHIEPREVKTLGLQLIALLVRQIKGSYTIHRGQGTRWEIAFTACAA
jgi:PAS domain S-box-containing protein